MEPVCGADMTDLVGGGPPVMVTSPPVVTGGIPVIELAEPSQDRSQVVIGYGLGWVGYMYLFSIQRKTLEIRGITIFLGLFVFRLSKYDCIFD